MKNLNNKEKKFAEILSDLNLEINTDEIWDSIEDRLPVESTKRKFPFWIFGKYILLLFVASVSFLLVFNNDRANTNIVTENSQFHNSNYTSKNEVFQKSAALEAAIEKVTTAVSNELVTDAQNAVTSDMPKVVREPVESRNSFATRKIDNISPYQFIKTVSEASVNDVESISISSEQDQKQREIFSINQLQRVSTLSPEALIHQPIEFNIGFTQVAQGQRKLQRYYQLGLGLVSNSANYFLDSAEGIDVNSVNQYESSLPGFNASAIAGLETEKGWRFFGGVRYIQLVNLYRNQDFNSSTSTSNGTQRFNLDEQGNSTPINGEIVTTTTRQNAINWHRQFHNVDIVAGLGKQLYQLNDWSLATELALNFNVISASNGYVFVDDFSTISKYPQVIENPFGAMGLGASVSIQIQKNIGDTFSLFCSPFYSQYFEKLDSGSFYETNNSQLGLQLGMRYFPKG